MTQKNMVGHRGKISTSFKTFLTLTRWNCISDPFLLDHCLLVKIILSKKLKDRFTIFLARNMIGSEKREFLLLGKSKKSNV